MSKYKKIVGCLIRKGNRLAACLSLFVGTLTVSVSFEGQPVGLLVSDFLAFLHLARAPSCFCLHVSVFC